MAVTSRPLPMAADLYGDIEPSPNVSWRRYLPVLAIAAMGTLAAGLISDHYGAPLTLMASLIGPARNFLSVDALPTPAPACRTNS